MSAPSSSSDRAAHDTWAAHYAARDGFRYWPCEELVRFVGRRGHSLGRTLEVGCGNGANLWFLAEHADTITGVDICDLALNAAHNYCYQRLGAPGLRPGLATWELLNASAFDLPFGSGTFETVVDCMVGQHVSWDDHVALFREYRRVLVPGGWVFVYHLVAGTTGTVARAETFDYPHGIALFPKGGRVCLPDWHSLAHRLTACGFAEVEKRGMERTYPDGSRARYAVLEGQAR